MSEWNYSYTQAQADKSLLFKTKQTYNSHNLDLQKTVKQQKRLARGLPWWRSG